MNHIEDEYRGRFKNQQLPNDQFDTEGLWDNISEELDHKKKRRKFIFWNKWFSGLLILLIAVGFSFVTINNDMAKIFTKDSEIIDAKLILDTCLITENQIEETQDQPRNSPYLNQKKVSETLSDPIYKNAPSLHSKQLINAEAEDLPPHIEQPLGDKSEGNSVIGKINLPSAKVIPSLQEVEQIGRLRAYEEVETLTQGASTHQLTPSNSMLDEVQLFEAKAKEQPTERRVGTNTLEEDMSSPQSIDFNRDMIDVELALLPTYDFVLNYERPLEKLFVTKEQVKIDNPVNTKWSIGLYSGANVTRFQFRSKMDSTVWSSHQKNETEKGVLGTTLGIEAGVVLNDEWILQSGVEYNQLWSKFEYYHVEYDSVLKENELLRVIVDDMGNVIDEIYGDTSVNVLSTHTIVHHNKFDVFSIPINVGFVNTAKKWTYGLSAGVRLNFLVNQVGRTQSTSIEVIDFDKNTPPVLHNSFSLGLELRPFLGCQITEKLMLTMKPSWAWQSNKIFDDPNLRVRMQTFNLNIGIQKSFGKN